MSKITLEALKSVTVKSQRSMITQDLVDKLNQWGTDPKLMESYGENVLSYINVLKEGKFKITDYMNAVRFVSYKMMGYTDIDAYIITFPDRYERLLADGVPREDMSPYVSAYKKNALVVKIFEQTVIPINVLNNHMAQDSLNELMKIGLHGRSEMARVAALSKVLDKTDAPDVKKMQLDMNVNTGDAIADLRTMLSEAANEQLEYIEKGRVDLKTLGALKPKSEDDVIEVDVDE
jgi:hypothetical protein